MCFYLSAEAEDTMVPTLRSHSKPVEKGHRGELACLGPGEEDRAGWRASPRA